MKLSQLKIQGYLTDALKNLAWLDVNALPSCTHGIQALKRVVENGGDLQACGSTFTIQLSLFQTFLKTSG